MERNRFATLRPAIGDRLAKIREKIEGRNEVDDVIDATVSKVNMDLARGGYTLLRGSDKLPGGDYEQTIINQVVWLRNGGELYQVGLTAVSSLCDNETLKSNRLSLDISDNLDLSDQPSGIVRHGSVHKERHEWERTPGKVEVTEAGSPHFFKTVKYDLNSPECPTTKEGYKTAAASFGLSGVEIIQFCQEIMGAEIDVEATQHSYRKSEDYYPTARHNDLRDMYWNTERNSQPKLS